MKKNHKIITEFMEYIKVPKIYPKDKQILRYKNRSFYEDSLEFDKDWNLLMEVVEKIEKEFCSTNIHYYSQKQMYSVEFLGFNIEYDNSEYGDNKMKILYDSCIKFINFYNKQKEE